MTIIRYLLVSLWYPYNRSEWRLSKENASVTRRGTIQTTEATAIAWMATEIYKDDREDREKLHTTVWKPLSDYRGDEKDQSIPAFISFSQNSLHLSSDPVIVVDDNGNQY